MVGKKPRDLAAQRASVLRSGPVPNGDRLRAVFAFERRNRRPKSPPVLARRAAFGPPGLARTEIVHPDSPGLLSAGLDAAETGAQPHWLAGAAHLVRPPRDLGLVCRDDFHLQRRLQQ